jgi:hypothetical protein
MNSKLTLTIEQNVVEKAKLYAKAKGRSLSDIVENYFKTIVKENRNENATQSPISDSLRGSFKEPDNFNYKNSLSNAIIKKHLQDG